MDLTGVSLPSIPEEHRNQPEASQAFLADHTARQLDLLTPATSVQAGTDVSDAGYATWKHLTGMPLTTLDQQALAKAKDIQQASIQAAQAATPTQQPTTAQAPVGWGSLDTAPSPTEQAAAAPQYQPTPVPSGPAPPGEEHTVEAFRGVHPGRDSRSTEGSVGNGLFYSPHEHIAHAYSRNPEGSSDKSSRIG